MPVVFKQVLFFIVLIVFWYCPILAMESHVNSENRFSDKEIHLIFSEENRLIKNEESVYNISDIETSINFPDDHRLNRAALRDMISNKKSYITLANGEKIGPTFEITLGSCPAD